MTEVEAFVFINKLLIKGHEIELDRTGNEHYECRMRSWIGRAGYGNTLLNAIEDLDDKLKAELRDAVYKKLMS